VNYLGLAVGTVTHPATQGLTATTGTFSDALTATTGAFSGKITADAGIDIDNFNIDGNTIALSSGHINLDSAGQIFLDSGDGGTIQLKDSGTAYANFYATSDDFYIKTMVSDKDLKIMGVDGGSQITALTLDMSAAGAATFNSSVTENSDERLKSNITTIPDALSKVTEMRGVHYIRKDTGLKRTGLIAQELQKIAPELVSTGEDEMSTLSVSYANVVGYLIEAVKELSEKVAALEAK
jgi:hypothetical protein